MPDPGLRPTVADVVDQSAPIHDGVVHGAYANPRPEVTALVPAAATTVLDVGCSSGVMSAALARSGKEVTGLELDPVLAGLARQSIADVVEADVEELAARGDDLGGRQFDCVVFADVLEHLRDPWGVARWGAGRVAPGGSMVISVPNIRHLETFWSLAVRRRWPYKEVGIFDRTHLRFFARANLATLVDGTGFDITELTRTHMLRLAASPASPWNRAARFLGDLGTLQFVFRAERTS